MRRKPARIPPPGSPLPTSCLKVLAAICQAADRGKQLSLRQLARQVGLAHIGGTFLRRSLIRLQQEGLIHWEPGLGRTLRPACRLVLFRQQPAQQKEPAA